MHLLKRQRKRLREREEGSTAQWAMVKLQSFLLYFGTLEIRCTWLHSHIWYVFHTSGIGIQTVIGHTAPLTTRLWRWPRSYHIWCIQYLIKKSIKIPISATPAPSHVILIPQEIQAKGIEQNKINKHIIVKYLFFSVIKSPFKNNNDNMSLSNAQWLFT